MSNSAAAQRARPAPPQNPLRTVINSTVPAYYRSKQVLAGTVTSAALGQAVLRGSLSSVATATLCGVVGPLIATPACVVAERLINRARKVPIQITPATMANKLGDWALSVYTGCCGDELPEGCGPCVLAVPTLWTLGFQIAFDVAFVTLGHAVLSAHDLDITTRDAAKAAATGAALKAAAFLIACAFNPSLVHTRSRRGGEDEPDLADVQVPSAAPSRAAPLPQQTVQEHVIIVVARHEDASSARHVQPPAGVSQIAKIEVIDGSPVPVTERKEEEKKDPEKKDAEVMTLPPLEVGRDLEDAQGDERC